VKASYVLGGIVETIERCKQSSPVLDRKGKPVMVETPTEEIAPAARSKVMNCWENT